VVKAGGRLERRLEGQLLFVKERLLMMKQIRRELIVLYVDEVVEVGGVVGVVVAVKRKRPQSDGIVAYRRMRQHSLVRRRQSQKVGTKEEGRKSRSRHPGRGAILIYTGAGRVSCWRSIRGLATKPQEISETSLYLADSDWPWPCKIDAEIKCCTGCVLVSVFQIVVMQLSVSPSNAPERSGKTKTTRQ
jgi:hypothetical protein